MDTNENHALAKAEGCYHCKPLVQQRDELAEKIAMLEHKLANVGSQLTLTMAEVSSLRSSNDRVAQERNELVAYAERLRKLIMDEMAEPECCNRPYGDPETGPICCGIPEFILPDHVAEVLSETPPAALSALKAQWQAEAASEVMMILLRGYIFHQPKWVPHFREEVRSKFMRAQEAGDE